MIPNPPAIQSLLLTWKRIAAQVPACLHAEYLAALFRHAIEPALPYGRFLDLYNLYLQPIPVETAKEAWGIHVAADCIRPAKHTLSQTKPKQ